MTMHHTLTQIGHQSEKDIDLVHGALALAQWADPSIDRRPYKRHVQNLVQRVKDYVADDSDNTNLILEAVRQIIAKRYGYAGPIDEDSPQDGLNLARVIDHRRGASLSLCILYAYVLENLGQYVEIIDFPTRSLVRTLGHREHYILDPLKSGQMVTARRLRSLFQSASETSPFSLTTLNKREVLIRLQDNLKLDLLRQNAPEAAIQALQASILMAPHEPRLWRELGLLHSRLNHLDDSIQAFEQFLRLPGNDEYRYNVSQLLQQLQARKDTLNP